MTEYRVTKRILSGTFAGMDRSEITNVHFEVGFKCEEWAYGPPYLVIACEPYDRTKDLHEDMIRAARILSIIANKFAKAYQDQDISGISAESPFNEDSETLIDAAKRLIEREQNFWKHIDGR
jgi:hypothetical protein